MSDKREDFLWIVQTILLYHGKGVGGFHGIAGDAIAASYRIPADMTARDAALDFCGFMVNDLRHEYEKNEGRKRECPTWFSNLREPAQSVYETRGILSI